MKYAFLIKGPFHVAEGRAGLHGGGAFGSEDVWEIIRATGGRLPGGYVTLLPEQKEVYRAAFPG